MIISTSYFPFEEWYEYQPLASYELSVTLQPIASPHQQNQ